MKEFALPLLVLSHAYVVPRLKNLCEWWLEHRLITTENAIDIFQLSLLCDAPRLCLMCHRFIMSNLKAVRASDGWKDMKESHPVLEKEILESILDQDAVSILTDFDIADCGRIELNFLSEHLVVMSSSEAKGYDKEIKRSKNILTAIRGDGGACPHMQRRVSNHRSTRQDTEFQSGSLSILCLQGTRSPYTPFCPL